MEEGGKTGGVRDKEEGGREDRHRRREERRDRRKLGDKEGEHK